MKGNLESQNKIREYLLGRLAGDEATQRQIEEKLLLDDEYADKLSIAETELIEEYLDGNLSRGEEKSFNEFFLAAPERKKHFRLVKNLQKYSAQSEKVKEIPKKEEKKTAPDWRGWFALPSVRAAFAVLVVCALGFAVWRAGIYKSESDAEKGWAQLQVVFRGQRLFESRLTVNAEHQPFTNTRSGSGSGGSEADRQRAFNIEAARKGAEVFLQDAAKNPPDAARAHHALGLLYMAERKFDDAAVEFNLALKIEPDNAKIYSDLGALYLEKSRLASPEDEKEVSASAELALRNLDSALKLDENLPEALFNRALLLQKMPAMKNEARAAWEKYLEKDSRSKWAEEARRNLE